MPDINWQAIGLTILPNLGGVIGGIITKKNLDNWYMKLNRREWYPPNWVFGPVWTVIYCSAGYASYLVLKRGGGFNGPAKLPLTLYGANLVANWAWSPIFFGLHNPRMALANMLLIDATVLGMAVTFYRIKPAAGLLIVPYCLWMSFATVLNALIVKDNPEEPEEKID